MNPHPPAPIARFDDLTADGASWEFHTPAAGGEAWSLHEVLSVIAAGERRAEHHREWVVMVLAYEAATAFDPAMHTAAAPPAGVPFVWWRSFADRRRAEPLDHPESQVVERYRRQGRTPFREAVEVVRARIAAGDVYQVNVTDRFGGSYRGTPFEMYAALVGVQSCAFGAYVDLGATVIASASPELFFRWDDGGITCRPMKGTTPRLARPDADTAAAATLVASAKERAENVMIVDLLRNDLGRLATIGSVTVPELFTVERYETVWQLTSTVHAAVAANTGLVNVLAALFPCGSVTGAPKVAAMDVICELESEPRGVYCGAIGVLTPAGLGPRAVFSVPIRTAVLDRDTATFQYGAGAGITWSSNPHDEDDEVIAKARILTRSHRPLSLLETLRNDADGLAHVDAHLARLAASAAWFGFPFDRAAAGAALADIAPSPNPQRVRLLVSPTGGATVQVSALQVSPDPVVLAIDDAVTRSDDPFCCHKTTWRRHYDEARARHRDADDVVLVNEFGNAIETTVANLAFRIGDWWHVPPLSDGGLPGIGREVALADGRVTERSIRAAELTACDEIALVSALRGWRPARLAR